MTKKMIPPAAAAKLAWEKKAEIKKHLLIVATA